MVKSNWINKFNPFRLDDIIHRIDKNVKTIQDCNNSKIQKLQGIREELELEKQKRQEQEQLFVSVINHLPDMVWAKDLQGRYIMANEAFMKNFCYGMSWDELQGKTDIEIATIFKNKVGHTNHTFGEICENSDKIVHETEEARQFLEHGKIDGKTMKLVVHKSPVYDMEGTLYAVCGTGRDITEWHDELVKAIDSPEFHLCDEGKEFLRKVTNKYEFKLD